MPSPRVTPVQIGYRSHHPTLANVDQHHPTFPQATGHPDHQSPGQDPPSGATSPNAARSKQNMPSPGGQVSRMASHQARAGSGVGRGCGIPSTSLKGYRTAPQGQSSTRSPPVASRAAPGAPCGRAYARSTGFHTAPSVQVIAGVGSHDQAVSRPSDVGQG